MSLELWATFYAVLAFWPLTNRHLHQFDQENRIDLRPEGMSWVLLVVMLKAGGAM